MKKQPQSSSENVLSMIHILSNRVTRSFLMEVEPKFDITLAEWRVLLMLCQHPGATAIEITNRWSMEKMAVNRAIRKLEESEAISRTRKHHDRRSYELYLTEKGQKIYESIVPAANTRYQQIVSALNREELASLARKLNRLLKRTEELE